MGPTGPLCHPVSLSEISIERLVREKIWRSAADFQHRNMMVYGDTGFTIEINGHMESIGSSISVEISASGTLSINDTKLDRVGPIILEEDDSAIILGGNSGSLTAPTTTMLELEVSQPLGGGMMSSALVD
ncbi:MAG: hypothetical protein Ct9H90mP24_8070 [Methanobacteriota archaeon]|nr:MAG: hypothetical protein Ct9H90mP24_8070 [Euryarchaeota archaeon]